MVGGKLDKGETNLHDGSTPRTAVAMYQPDTETVVGGQTAH